MRLRTKKLEAATTTVARAPDPMWPRATPARAIDTALAGVTNAGLPLPHLSTIQRAFGVHDVGHIRTAIGGRAADAALALGARAYAIGDQVAFRRDPDLHLAAHEAAHVVQQRAGLTGVAGMGRSYDAFERHADVVADAVVSGRSAEHLLSPAAASGSSMVQMACECGDCARCKVQRAPDDAALASTPGGLRIGALDPDSEPAVKATFDLILPHVETFSLAGLERDYETKHARSIDASEQLEDEIARAMQHANSALDGRITDAALRSDTKRLLARDVAVVFARAFQQARLDRAAIKKPVVAIGATYERLAYIYTNDQIEWQSGAPKDVRDEFNRRAQLFLDFAKDKLGGASEGMLRVRQGLAADLARLAANDRDAWVLAPDRGGELLVYRLLANPPQLEELVALFQKVVDDVRWQVTPSESALLHITFVQHANEIIRTPITNELAAATTDIARAQARRRLSIKIGRFLARFDVRGAFSTTYWYVAGVGPLDSAPRAIKEQIEIIEKELEAPTPVTPPKPAPPRPPPAPPRVYCPTTYSLSDVAGHFDKAIGIERPGRRNVKFGVRELLCQFRGGSYSDEQLAAAQRHLADWKESSARVASELRKQIQVARARDAEITRRRIKIVPEKAMATIELKDLVPDLVEALRISHQFWFLLQHVTDERDFDPTDAEAMYTQLAFPYFFSLRRHQEQLLAITKLVIDTEKSGLAAFIKDRYAATLGLHFAEMREKALEIERWPWPENDLLAQAEGFGDFIANLTHSLRQAEADRQEEHRAEMEREIYGEIEWQLSSLYRGKRGSNRDMLGVEEVWDAIKDRLTTVGKGEDHIAKEIITQALGDVYRARFMQLFSEAQKAQVSGDTQELTAYARRMSELEQRLNRPIAEGTADAFIMWVRGYSMSLIGIWAMAESSLAVGAGAMRPHTPGAVMRAANLLRLGIEEGGAATLGESFEWIKKNQYELMLSAQELEGRKKILDDSNKGIRDKLEMWMAGKVRLWTSFVAEAIDILEESRRKGALKYLVEAENERNELKRKVSIAELAQMMGRQKASHSKATAQFIYSFLLDAVVELQEASESVKQDLADAELAKTKLQERKIADAAARVKDPARVKPAAELKEEAAWRAAIAKVQVTPTERLGTPRPDALILEGRAEKSRSHIIPTFKSGNHPVHGRPLTDPEKVWFSEWERIGSFSEKGWAELKEFGEGLLIAFAVGYITGGIGRVLLGGFIEAPVLLKLGVTVAEVSAFTQSMRLIQDIQTGQSSQTSFTEELIVNLVMMGAGKFAMGRMARSLERHGIALKSMRGRLNMFVAEYLATSGVGIAHLYVGTMLRGGGVTTADIKTSLLHNFGFMVGMKAMHAFSTMPQQAFENERRTWQDPIVAEKYKRLNETLAPLDAVIQKTVKATLDAETPEQRAEMLEAHAQTLENKAKRIEESGIPDAAAVAEGLRAGIEVFRADARRAIALEKIGARHTGDPNSPNISYEKSGKNEAALEALLVDSNTNFKMHERTDGSKVYTVYTADGILRYEPREPGTGGTQKEAYAKTGRLKSEAVPGKTKGNVNEIETAADVVAVLNASSAKQIPNVVGGTFKIGSGLGECTVTIEVVASVASSSDHGAGPAVFELKMNKAGGWEAKIKIRKNTPNDHIVRGTNHEVAELGLMIARLEARAKQQTGGRDAYKTAGTLGKAMAQERSAASLKDPSKPLSSHGLATFNADVATVEVQLRGVMAQLNSNVSGAERSLLEARRDLLLKDVGAIWVMLDLPVKQSEFEARLKELEKQGVDTTALLALKQMRIAGTTPADLTMADLHIIFEQLKIANPHLVPEGSFLGMKLYYEEKVREDVAAAIAKVRKKGGTDAEAHATAKVAAYDALGRGTSIASWRGRAFEGLLIDKFNADPALVSAYGRLYQIELNNFPTYDVVGVKLTVGKNASAASAKSVPTPLSFDVVVITTGKTETKVLVIKDANDREIARQTASGKFTIHVAGVEVWLASLKAKDNAQIGEMQKAIGTPAKPTEQSMYVTPEYMESLEGMIQRTQERITRMSGKAGLKKELAAAKSRLAKLEFFKQNIDVMKDLTNVRIDALLRELKDAGIDTDAIVKEAIQKKKKKGP